MTGEVGAGGLCAAGLGSRKQEAVVSSYLWNPCLTKEEALTLANGLNVQECTGPHSGKGQM